MKAIAKPNSPAQRPRRSVTVPSTPAKVSAEKFRHQLHHDLAAEIAAARQATQERFGHLLRPHTPAEIKARSAAARALFAQWEKEDRKDPPPFDDWEKFKALLEENRMRSAPIFAE